MALVKSGFYYRFLISALIVDDLVGFRGVRRSCWFIGWLNYARLVRGYIFKYLLVWRKVAKRPHQKLTRRPDFAHPYPYDESNG